MTPMKLDLLLGLANDIYEAIESSPNGLPSGHLYAALMGMMPLGLYQTLIDGLVGAGRITNNGHLLKAVTR